MTTEVEVKVEQPVEAKVEVYKPKNHVRFVTASSLFDGHDVSVNIMRRILQSSGAEVIHLGHNRSVEEVVNAAIHYRVVLRVVGFDIHRLSEVAAARGGNASAKFEGDMAIVFQSI